MRSALVILAPGFEELEAVTVVDILRRSGIRVTLAGTESGLIEGAHGIRIQVETTVDQAPDDDDAVILPGGMPGSANLDCPEVRELVKTYWEDGKIVGAICAAPAVALGPMGILSGHQVTCFPGFEDKLPKDAEFVQDDVVVDGNLITSRGPGTAAQFALTIVEKMVGARIADKWDRGMLWNLR